MTTLNKEQALAIQYLQSKIDKYFGNLVLKIKEYILLIDKDLIEAKFITNRFENKNLANIQMQDAETFYVRNTELLYEGEMQYRLIANYIKNTLANIKSNYSLRNFIGEESISQERMILLNKYIQMMWEDESYKKFEHYILQLYDGFMKMHEKIAAQYEISLKLKKDNYMLGFDDNKKFLELLEEEISEFKKIKALLLQEETTKEIFSRFEILYSSSKTQLKLIILDRKNKIVKDYQDKDIGIVLLSTIYAGTFVLLMMNLHKILAQKTLLSIIKINPNKALSKKLEEVIKLSIDSVM